LCILQIPLEGDRCIGEYGIQEGMELEVEKIGKKVPDALMFCEK